MYTLGNDHRRIGTVRVIVLPVVVATVFLVGYMFGSRSSSDTNIELYRPPPPGGSKNEDQNDSPGQLASPPLEEAHREAPDPVRTNPKSEQVEEPDTRAEPNPELDRTQPNNPHENNVLHLAESGSNPKSKPKTRNTTMQYEVVVAHFDEDLDWLKPYARQAGHVYHKGPQRGPPFEILSWEVLPNVGREAHTYIYHILQNYDRLADVTVFLKGHGPAQDKAWCYSQPIIFVDKAKKGSFCKKQGGFSAWNRMQHVGKWLDDLKSGKMRKAKLTFGEFYTALFGTSPPKEVPKCFGSCFAATRENLRRHPTIFYQMALSYLEDHHHPEEVHYMESLWAVIIGE